MLSFLADMLEQRDMTHIILTLKEKKVKPREME